MELKIGAQELAKALGRSQGIVEKKSTMPILSHVLLEAKKGDQLVVSATDLDLAVSSEHACEVLKEGAVAVSARHLYEIVRALPEQTVTLKKAHNNYLEVKSGPSEFRIVGLPAEDFPALPRFDKVPFAPVDPALLLEMIERTFFAVSNDETRYNLNGVYFEPAGDALRLVATDGHRLSLSERAVGATFGLKRGVILPKKGLAELKKLLAEAAESGEEQPEAKLGFVENSAIFRRPNVVLVMRLIEGLFPDYKQVIPKAGEKVFKVGRGRFLETLRRISLLSSDKAHAVKLDLSKDLLRVLSQNPDLGEAKEEVPVEYAGEPLKIGFNARYIMEVLQAVKSNEVVFELADDLSPGVLKGGEEADQGFTAVVMPMRI
ncbi:DNA polymerase III, beta subunit [Anaeromyxobacter dehalogenans 2CP-1]|uniref:Beta sliding clamp n=1 Tax=Anaeromyxobacter dehalogenans (strain ATCC BAA-258 / DSM 21875 / 2CP-1) TaxID=455488 RepID=B8J6Y2_ANAD2|nr:DNA polymerase III subunit beta [Anaeromyxobacter dehalogenans]ACL63363.1 DNA polymerase III, beta subunit [Anaeromyxobacter dehalogenans 2CP-1]